MYNYYKIPKNSPTGKKLTELKDKCTLIRSGIKNLCDKYGACEAYTMEYYSAGGVVELKFPRGFTVQGEPIDTKGTWKQGKAGIHAYAFRNNVNGKNIEAEFDALGKVYQWQWADLVNIKDDPFASIGYKFTDEYIYVYFDENESDGIPEDLIEITASEFKKAFGDYK